MATIAVQKIEDKNTKRLPLFEEIEKQFDKVRQRAFQLFETRQNEADHDLEDWLRAEHEVMGWPAAELKEADSGYDLALTLPGYEPKEVEVTVTPKEIIVHANTEQEKKGAEKKCVWSEFQSNEIYRRFELPEAIDPDKATANLDKGMLHVRTPKMPRTLAKPIKVQAG